MIALNAEHVHVHSPLPVRLACVLLVPSKQSKNSSVLYLDKATKIRKRHEVKCTENSSATEIQEDENEIKLQRMPLDRENNTSHKGIYSHNQIVFKGTSTGMYMLYETNSCMNLAISYYKCILRFGIYHSISSQE